MLGLIAAVSALVVAFYLMVQYQKMQWAGGRLPPGPAPLPLLGNLWALNFKLEKDTLDKLAKVYGNVFTLWLQQTPMIVRNGFLTVKEGLTTYPEDVSHRPVTPFFKGLVNGKGIVFSNGHIWKQQRRFGIIALRNLGMGKKSLEERIQAEAHHLVEMIKNERGQPFDPLISLSNCVMNVICAVVYGHRFSVEDETFHQLFEASFAIKTEGAPYKIGEDPSSSFNEQNLVQSIADIFLAGSETMATTLHWALLHMVTHPAIQDKVRKELEDVLGTSQDISYEDREKLPYTNAVIHEVQCFSEVTWILFRRCMKNTKVNGFSVEKDTIILVNLGSALYDPKEWKNPQQFDPNNFLDNLGNFVNREAFLPFSTGHCVCLGEKLAKAELFILFATLMRAFTFQLPEEVKQINTQPVLGAVLLYPHPYKLCAVPC
ncbi:cytochrome P450 2J6-like [Rhineura floridana]|uniref:cytochrome P450 2J6-like n=1 Tax=Rhineura floridana TaxID=261503 RepID=UPI002AC8282A|nr:cytochrome P450 2J6-like [Rhineura floridana]